MLKVRVWLLLGIIGVGIAACVLLINAWRGKDVSSSDTREPFVPAATAGQTAGRSEAGQEIESKHEEGSTRRLPRPVPVDLGGMVEVSGRVFSPDGVPVEKAWVIVSSSRDQGYASTDEAGRFVCVELQPGRYILKAEHKDYARVVLGPADLEADHALVEVEITLAVGGFLSGVVTDEHDKPVRDASVMFTAERELRVAGMSKEELRERLLLNAQLARTDRHGRYTSPALRPGSYRVDAYEEEHLGAKPRRADVEPSRTTAGVDLVLLEGVTIRGRFVDWEGRRVPRVRVFIHPHEYGEGSSRDARARLDGSFVIRGVVPGLYDLSASADGFLDFCEQVEAPADSIELKLCPLPRLKGRVIDKATREPVERFAVAFDVLELEDVERNHPDGRFELVNDQREGYTLYVKSPNHVLATLEGVRGVDGTEPEEVLVELEQGAGVAFEVVSAEDGLPIEGVRVSPEKGWVRPEGFLMEVGLEMETDAQGKCSAEHVPLGEDQYELSHPEYAVKRVPVVLTESGKTKSFKVTLDRGMTVRGCVVAKADGTPVAGARVELLCFLSGREFVSLEATTDAYGEFVVDRVGAGEYSVIVEHEEYSRFSGHTQIPEGYTKKLLVALEGQARIAGTVTMQDGTPVAGANVMLFQEYGGNDCDTDADGDYALEGVTPGTYQLVVRAGEGSFIKNITVGPGQEARVDVVLGGFALYGAITRNGHPIDYILVSATPRSASFGEGEGSQGSSGRGGREGYRIEALHPGDYKLRLASGFGWLPGTREVRIVDRDVQLDIEIGGLWIQGVVLAPDGRPALDARVIVLPDYEGPDRMEGLVHAYHVESLWRNCYQDGGFLEIVSTPGRYRIVAQRRGFATKVVPIEVTGDKDINDLKIVLDREVGVVVHARCEDGTTPDRIWVAVCDEAGRVMSGQVVDAAADGSFRIEGVGPGRYKLVAKAPGCSVARTDLTVTAEAEASAEIEFVKGRPVTVMVCDDSGAPVRGADVILDPGGDLSLVSDVIKVEGARVSGDDGCVQCSAAPGGEYVIRVRCSGYKDATIRLEAASSDEQVTVSLERDTGE